MVPYVPFKGCLTCHSGLLKVWGKIRVPVPTELLRIQASLEGYKGMSLQGATGLF